MDYTIVVRRSVSGHHIASCPSIPECHAQGDTYEEAVHNAKEALRLCIEYMEQQGERLPEEVGSEKVLV